MGWRCMDQLEKKLINYVFIIKFFVPDFICHELIKKLQVFSYAASKPNPAIYIWSFNSFQIDKNVSGNFLRNCFHPRLLNILPPQRGYYSDNYTLRLILSISYITNVSWEKNELIKLSVQSIYTNLKNKLSIPLKSKSGSSLKN